MCVCVCVCLRVSKNINTQSLKFCFSTMVCTITWCEQKSSTFPEADPQSVHPSYSGDSHLPVNKHINSKLLKEKKTDRQKVEIKERTK